jgi:hypothetical protein
MRARIVLTTAAATVLWAVPAHAGKISSGTITVGQGANGATLGMTKQQVIDHLGRPLDENPQGVLSYQPFLGHSDGIFDVYRGGAGKTVDLFIISFPDSGKWVLDDGNKIFKAGAIKRLYDHYGSRVHKVNAREDGSLYYTVRGRFQGKKVKTAFQVDRFSKTKAKVLDVFISYR